jgi:hypothetical protein
MNADVGMLSAAIMRVAPRLSLGLATHESVMQRAGAATTKIAERIEGSRTNGTLSAFNQAYRERRLAAQHTGARMMPYNMMLARLNRAMASHAAAAQTGAIPPDILRAVFGE